MTTFHEQPSISQTPDEAKCHTCGQLNRWHRQYEGHRHCYHCLAAIRGIPEPANGKTQAFTYTDKGGFAWVDV